jgi:LysM repeat protein
VILLAVVLCSKAQDDAIIREYINTYHDLAISEMQRSGVPASIKLAQGIHETMAGTSVLVKKSNNHFGIKCKSNWTGESVSHTDDAPNECFRKYDNPKDSYKDHSDFLKSSARYAGLFKLDPLDYKDWAYGLKKAGYATNPRYPQVIIKLIEDYHLQDYSLIALGKMSPEEKEKVYADLSTGSQQGDVTSNNSPFLESIVVDASVMGTDKKTPAPVNAVTKTVEAKMPDNVIPETEKPDYPSGEFKINETRVVYVKKGTSFLSLAQQYNISLAWIFDFNEIEETEEVEQDQLIYLQRKRRTGNQEFHIVKEGETLNDIAREEAIRIEALMEYNHLDRYKHPAIGEQLYLRTKSPAPPRLAD